MSLTPKGNVVPWIGSWNRKRSLVEKLVKSKTKSVFYLIVWYCTNVNFLVFIIITWLYNGLMLGEAG